MVRSSTLVWAACVVVHSMIVVPCLAREAGFRAKGEARRGVLSSVDPGLLLRDVYVALIMVRRCYEARQGSLSIFIDDAELARANGEARSTSERIKVFAPSVRDDLAWRYANEQVGPFSQNRQNCSGSLSYLDRTYERSLDGR